MKKSTAIVSSFVGIAVISALLFFLNITPQSINTLFASNQAIGAGKPPVNVPENVRAFNNAMVEVSEAVLPTVVSIQVVVETKFERSPFRDQFREFFKFFGEPFDQGDEDRSGTRRSEASGSGVIVTSDGYIVTNHHVVENASEINVVTNDGKRHKAKLIGEDPLTDLALIKIEGTGFQAAHLADIDNVRVGETVIAVGNPLGLNSTVTSGIVSQIGRGGLNPWQRRDGYQVEYFIQTDAAINPGNSGGGLYNIEGSLVGINTAIATRTGTYIGYGFAIPVDLVRAVVSDLMEDGQISRGYIGVRITTITESIAKFEGLERVEGVVINDVIAGGSGEKAGLKPGDIILEVNGRKVKTSNELQSMIVLHRAGDLVKLTIHRDGKRITKDVKLAPRDGSEDTIADSGDNPKKGEPSKPIDFEKLGMTVSPLTKEQTEQFAISNGVFITKVDRYSPAGRAGIVPNGVIIKVDRKDIASTADIQKILKGKGPGDIALFQIRYEQSNIIIAVEIPEDKK